MTLATQPRRPAGRPDGGRYDTTTIAAPAVSSLVTGITDPSDDDWEREILPAISIICRRRVQSRDFADELAADVSLQVLTNARAKPVRITFSYIKAIAARRANAMRRTPGTDPEDDKARALWSEQVYAQELDLGRELTAGEQHSIATRIRSTWVSTRGHRPSPLFYMPQRTASLYGDDGIIIDVAVHDVAPEDRPRDLEPETEDLLARTESDPHLRRVDRTVVGWQVMRDLHDSPTPIAGLITRARATALRSRVEAAGGVATVIDRWENGTSDQVTESLFEPFGRLDETDQQAVVTSLKASGVFADDMWRTAVTYASTSGGRNLAVHA